MSTKAQSVLDTDDLNDTDEAILELMRDGRVTPPLVAKKLQKSREYASERLIRMKEHGNATRIAPGLYELVDDPRDGTDVEEATVDESDLRDRLQDARAARDRHEERADDLQARLDTAGGPTPDRESLERVVCGVEAALMALDGRDPSIDAAKNELAAALETLQQLADD
jgi:DNA-binding Lrp family transcriptional regulator